MKKLFYLTFFGIICISNVYAYIDPMSGSAIIYFLLGIGATIFFALRGLFYRFKNLITGNGFIKQGSIEDHDIVFYSEGRQYWHVFSPVLKALDKMNIQSIYLTSDREDPGLDCDFKYVKTQYLGNSTTSFIYLNNISAKVLVLTLPQIDILTLKRSKNVEHYTHLVHAPVDIHTYRKFAFDYFDSVLCSGEHQINSIRFLEKKRGTPVKDLYKTGLTYYDHMLEEIKEVKKVETEKKVVLVAPTWKQYCIINRFGAEPLKILLDAGYKVILRPHPQTYVSFPEVIEDIEKELGENPEFSIDRNPSGINSMVQSDIMFSDMSGVIFDYMFLFNRPYVLLNASFDGGGMEGSEIEGPFWDLDIITEVSRIINEDQISNLPIILEEELNKKISDPGKNLHDKSLYNLGEAGDVAAKQIKLILEKVNSGDQQ